MNAKSSSRAGHIVLASLLLFGLVFLGWSLARRRDAPLTRIGTALAPPDASALAQLPRITLTRSEVKEPWPFTVPEGTLFCIGYHAVNVVVFEAGGVRYAINGKSRGRVTMGRYNLHDAREIGADDPAAPERKLDTREVLQRGLLLCPTTPAR